MAEDILSRIIQAEREIDDRIAAERQRAEEWLTLRRAEAEQRRTDDGARLRQDCETAVAAAVARAEQEAENIVREAAAEAGRLTALDDETLRQLIRETAWPAIRPGAA